MRIPVTMLESFRLFMEPEQEWMSEEDITATIRGEFKATPKMLLGQAFGRGIEKADKYRQTDGSFRVPVRFNDQWLIYNFTAELMAPALERFDRRGVFEVKTTKEYGKSVVVSKADQILGMRIIENKSTVSYFDFDKYAASFQWRFLLDMFGASALTYLVFCLDEDKTGAVELRSIEEFNFYPYPGMHEDCLELVEKFTHYVNARNLSGYLQEKQYA